MQDTIITDLSTTVLRHPVLPGIEDATTPGSPGAGARIER